MRKKKLYFIKIKNIDTLKENKHLKIKLKVILLDNLTNFNSLILNYLILKKLK